MKHLLIISIFFLFQCCFADDDYRDTQFVAEGDWPYGTFHAFGDSHAAFGFTNCLSWKEFTSLPPSKLNSTVIDEVSFYEFQNRKIPFEVHWLGPHTMHRIGRDGIDILAYGVKPNDVAIFLFGEIDCRIHIGRQVYLKNRSLNEVIGTLVENYVVAIANNQLLCNIRCAICAVPPASLVSFNLLGEDYGQYNSTLPSVPLSERVEYTKLINQELKSVCEHYGILFINPFESFANADGTLCQDFSDQGNHIRIEFNGIIKDRVLQRLLFSSIRYDDGIANTLTQSK